MPLSQSFSRRPTADKEPEELWARDWRSCGSVRTGPGKSWNFTLAFFQEWKVLEFYFGIFPGMESPGK